MAYSDERASSAKATRPLRAMVPRPIMALQAAGKTSLRAIAEGLNRQGIPTTKGGEWTAAQVLRVLNRVGVNKSRIDKSEI